MQGAKPGALGCQTGVATKFGAPRSAGIPPAVKPPDAVAARILGRLEADVTRSSGTGPSQPSRPSGGQSPHEHTYTYIRPAEWARALARAYDISLDQASSILAEVPVDDIHETGMPALAILWERSVESGARHALDRDVLAGMDLGYFRWRRRSNGQRVLGGTELASIVGIWQVSRDIAAAVATIGTEAVSLESDGEADLAEGTSY